MRPAAAARRPPVVPARVGSAAPHRGDVVERILLPTAGGPATTAVVDWIARRAGTHPVEVRAVRVVPGTALPRIRRRRGAHLLDAVHSRLERHAPTALVSSELVAGRPADVLAGRAADTDLVVIGRNRRRGPRAWDARRAAALLGRPVVVVGRAWRPSSGPVVLLTTGEAADDAAFAFATREADLLRRRLVVARFSPGSPAEQDPVEDRHPEVRLDRELEPDLELRPLLAGGAELVVLGRSDAVPADLRRLLDRCRSAVAVVPDARVAPG